MNNPNEHQGQAGINPAHAFMLLGNIYPSVNDFIAEPVENATDAASPWLEIILENDKFTFVDGGQGMVGFFHPDDVPTINQYKKLVGSGDVKVGYDLRDHVSAATLHSLQWMIEQIAFSSKRPTTGQKLRGMRGIGASLGWRQIGNKAIWITKPSLELAVEYWGPTIAASQIPVFALEPPTNEQLERNDMGYRISEVSRLRDSKGIDLEHGTRFEISNLKEGIMQNIRPHALATYLGNRFAEDIREGQFDIRIIDRRKGNQVIVVEAPVIKGIPLVNETLHMPKEEPFYGLPFKVSISYDPSSKNANAIQLSRKGTNISVITVMEEFNREPFNKAGMTGSIEFPDYTEKVVRWNTNKVAPDIAGSHRKKWVELVYSLIPQIQKELDQIESRSKQRRVKELAPDLAQATVEAMQQMPEYKDLVIRRTRTVEEPTTRTPKSLTRINAVVINEFGLGVKGAALLLQGVSPDNEELDEESHITGLSGRVIFKSRDVGRYKLTLVRLPDNAILVGDNNTYTFEINEEQRGVNVIFRLQTGGEAPERKKLPTLEIWFHAWGDPQQAYSISRLTQGMLEINTEEENLRKALDTKNEDMVISLLAVYVANAITEFSLSGEPSFLLMQASLLTGRIYENLQQRKSRKR